MIISLKKAQSENMGLRPHHLRLNPSLTVGISAPSRHTDPDCLEEVLELDHMPSMAPASRRRHQKRTEVHVLFRMALAHPVSQTSTYTLETPEANTGLTESVPMPVGICVLG